MGNGGSGSEGDASHNGIMGRNKIWGQAASVTPRYQHTPVTIPAISDGTSNTILATEKYVSTTLRQGGSWGDNTGWYSGWGWDTVRFGRQQPRQDGPTAAEGTWDFFGSAHSGGFNAAMADGSVRNVKYAVNITTLMNLSARNDGNVIANQD